MDNIAEDIEAKLKLNDDDLYAEIGMSFGKDAILFDPKKRGKEIFNSVLNQIRSEICLNGKIRKAYNEQSDVSFLIACIFDAVIVTITQKGLPVPPVTVSVLAFRTGLSNICSKYWNEKR